MGTLPAIAIAAILFVILAVGDVLSSRTKARVPAILTAIVLYLVGVWTGLIDGEVVTTSVVNQFGVMVISIALVHLGTLIPIEVLLRQWQSVLIAIGGLVVALTLILTIVTLVYDYPTAVSGSGPIAGGILAMLITTQELQEQGLDHLIVIPAAVIGLQGLVGIPLASALLRRYAVRYRTTPAFATAIARAGAGAGAGHHAATVEEIEAAPAPRELIPGRYQSSSVLLAVTAVLGTLAFYLGEWTGLNYGIWALLIGIGGQYVGLLPSKTLDKANSFGIVTAGILVVVLASMGGVTLSQLWGASGPVLLMLVLGATGLMVGGMAVGRLLRWPSDKAMPVSLTALIGFPADYIICEEIAHSLGEDEQERDAIMDEILAPMLVGGFTSVSLASVLIASILVGTI